MIKASGGGGVQTLLTDAELNPISGQTITISGPTFDGSSTTTAMTVGTGVATFSNLIIDTASTGVTLTATLNTLSAQSSTFNVTAGAIAHLAISQQPSPASVSADSTFSFSVTATDGTASANPVGGKVITLSLASNPTGATLTPTTVTTGDGSGGTTLGVATATLSINKVGTYTLQAKVGAITSAASSAVTVTTGAVSAITITTQPPASVAAGGAIPFAVTVTDKNGNPVANGTAVSLTLYDSTGTNAVADQTILTGGSGSTSGGAGVATFSAHVSKAGTYTLKAASGTVTSAASTQVTVTSGGAASLTISQQPSPASVSTDNTFSFAVTVKDAGGNPVANGTAVSLTLLQSDSTTVAADQTILTGKAGITTTGGVATFSALKIKTVGAYTLQATSGSAVSAVSSQVTITPGVPNVVTITAPASTISVAAGSSFAVTATVADASGNPVADGTLATLASTPSVAISGGTTTTSGGVATFSVQIAKSGSYTLKATSGAVTSAASSTITVTAGAVTQVAITGGPTPATVNADPGSTFSLQVTAKDASGNTVSGAPITLSLSSGPAGVVLTGGSANTNGSGVATFTLNVNKVGTYTLTAVSTGTGVASAPSSPVTVNAGAVKTVTITSGPTPSSVSAGGTFSLAATVTDNEGNPVADGTPVTASLTTANGAVLTGNSTTTSGGVANFNALSISKVGSYTLKVAAGTASATSPTVMVTPGQGTQVGQPVVTTSPAILAGKAFAVQVTVTDSSNNPIPGAPVSLTPAAGPSGATLTGGSATTGSNGVATFSVSLNKATPTDGSDNYTLIASVGTSSSSPSAPFSVGLNALSASFSGQPSPSSVAATQTFSASVTVQDASLNPAPDLTAVTLALYEADGVTPAPAGVTLTGGSSTTSSGVANFSALSINTIGNYKLIATFNPPAGTPAPNPHDGTPPPSLPSSQISVTPGPAAALSFPQPPATASADNAFPVKVKVVDAGGNNVPNGTSVTLSLLLADGVTPAPSGVTLTGGSSNTNGGLASFTLGVNKVGTYTLQATSGSATGVSSQFTVTLGALITTITQQPTPATVATNKTFSLKAVIADKNGNTVADGTAVVLTLSGTPTAGGTATLTGGSTTTAGGIANFSALSINKVGSYTLSVTAPQAAPAAPAPAVSDSVQVVVGPASLSLSAPTPASVSADTTFQITATVQDAQGNPVSDGTPVSLTLLQTDGVTPAPTSVTLTGGSATTAGGVATFTLNVDKVGSYKLRAASGSATKAVSSQFTVTLGALITTITQQPTPAAVAPKQNFSLAVTIKDAEDNPVTDGTPVSLALFDSTGTTASPDQTILTGEHGGHHQERGCLLQRPERHQGRLLHTSGHGLAGRAGRARPRRQQPVPGDDGPRRLDQLHRDGHPAAPGHGLRRCGLPGQGSGPGRRRQPSDRRHVGLADAASGGRRHAGPQQCHTHGRLGDHRLQRGGLIHREREQGRQLHTSGRQRQRPPRRQQPVRGHAGPAPHGHHPAAHPRDRRHQPELRPDRLHR